MHFIISFASAATLLTLLTVAVLLPAAEPNLSLNLSPLLSVYI